MIELKANQEEYSITNHSDSTISYGANFELERKEGEEWINVLEPNRPCILILYHLGIHNSESYSWGMTLQSGVYRIKKNVYMIEKEQDVLLECEFEVL